MRFVYVLEDDPKFQKDIIESILFIDPKIQIRLFSKLEKFVDWIRVMMTEGSASIVKGGVSPEGFELEPLTEEAHQLVLVISKIEFLGVKQISLLRKSRDLFMQRGICTKEDPTSIVLTAFDDPHYNLKELGDRILNNIIFKPFDRLILIQHLTFAIDGRHPASKYTIANQKTTAMFEMLKRVPVELLSEFGIVTRSNHPIKPGAIAKYYGEAFATERHRSIMAVTDRCFPHPMIPNEFQVSLRFFAADPTQISNIRKRIRSPNQPDANFKWGQGAGAQPSTINVVVVDPDEAGPSGIGGTLERKFQGLKVTHYEHYKNFLLDLDPNQMNSKDENPAKPFSGLTEMTFVFDSTGTLLRFDKPNESPVTLFGMGEKDILNKSHWFLGSLIDRHKDKFKTIFKSARYSLNADPFYMIIYEGNEYLLNLANQEILKDGHFALKFTEATKADWITYLQKSSRLPEKVDVVMVSHRFLGDAPAERWAFIVETLKKKGVENPKIFLLSVKDYSDAQEREMSSYLTDIFFRPVDRAYLAMKFYYFFPLLKVQDEPINLKTINEASIIKAANPVKVSELSEAGFVMEYYRAISIGSFREMVLWQPYEIGAPELLSNCNYTEEKQGEKGVYSCHFVFFGMTDHFLKNIRVWIRDNYIMSKEAQ